MDKMRILFVVPSIGYGRDMFFQTIRRLASEDIGEFHAFDTDLRIETENIQVRFVLEHRVDMYLQGNNPADILWKRNINLLTDYIRNVELYGCC